MKPYQLRLSSKFFLSHDYQSTYGTDYYQSLLEREQGQLEQSHVRLHGSANSCSAMDRSTSHHSLDSSLRMRTRSRRHRRLGTEQGPLLVEVDPDEDTEEDTNGEEQEEEEDSSASADRILNKVQTKITPRMRSTLVGWIMDVATETKLRHETLHYCIQLLDRVLEEIPLTKHNFQCFGWYDRNFFVVIGHDVFLGILIFLFFVPWVSSCSLRF